MLSSRALSNMFARTSDRLQGIQPGTTFRRMHPYNVVETAHIVAVSNDDAGIPHVRFNLRYQHPARTNSDVEQRTLALKSFAERYRD